MTTSLGKLQTKVTKLEQKVIQQNDRIEDLTKERDYFKRKANNLEASIDDAVKKAVEKAIEELKEYYEAIIKEKDQRIFELEMRLNINSSNSSTPSSKNPIYTPKICNSREKTDRHKGGQEKHKKSKLEKFKEEEVTETEVHELDSCPKCGSHHIEIIEVKERDELDYEIRIIKKRHKFPVGKCDECGAIIKAEIPSHLHAENNYGSNVKTLATTLNNYGYVAYNRTRKIISSLTQGEINPSEGYLVKLQKQASKKLEDFVFDAKEVILKSPQVQWDDTTVGIAEKDKACLRVYTNTGLALFKAHMSKDINSMDEDGILQNLPSSCTVMHDHLLHNYCNQYNYKNIECNAHITRKLEGITQNTKHHWSDDMKKLLEETLTKRKEYIANGIKGFDDNFIESFDERYDSIIQIGLTEYQEFKHKYEYNNEENLLEFLRDFKENITNWVRDFNLPYSNNLCESLIRFMKSKMKISYRFQSLSSARYFTNIMTYTESCGRHGINKVEALRRLFVGNPYSVQELLDFKSSQKNS